MERGESLRHRIGKIKFARRFRTERIAHDRDDARDRLRRGDAPAARRAARSSTARCSVTASTSSPFRSEALVSPSVTYGPYLPALITTALPVAGSSPSSRNEGAAAAWAPLPRVLGCVNRSFASARVTVNSISSLSSDRLSEPFFTYGP